jgi:hypothetical protein
MAGIHRERTNKYAKEPIYLLQELKTKGKNNIDERVSQASYCMPWG